jgi:DNA-binding NarL/FixJ family response regulator
LQINRQSTGGTSAEATARSLAHRSPDVETPCSAVPRAARASVNDLTLVAGEHPAKTVISDPASGVQTSSEREAVLGELAAGVTDSLCGPLGGNGRLGMPDRWRAPLGWDTQATNGARSDLARVLAEGHGILGDTRVLIVDDNTLYREYLAGAVIAHALVNPSVAWDLPSLITAIENTKPRVILLNMATRDSTMLLRRALKLSPTVRVIVLGMSEDDESEIVACAEAGVAGYHLRTESLGDLLVLIRKVAAGESLCSPRVSAILLRRLSALASQRQPAAGKELVLTAREVQILKMLELGLSNRDIADQLCIAVHTVKNHVHSLLTKLDVSTRAQAAALSRTLRYTDGESRN